MTSDPKQHAVFLRALTSRLSEVRGLVSLWGRGSQPLTEAAYLSTLRRVRDECHEWTAADVLRALQGVEGELLLAGPSQGGEGEDELWQELAGQPAAPTAAAPAPAPALLLQGFPAWSWPDYPRAPWLPLVCPVLEALLCSCYEDWLEVGTAAASALLGALAPLVELAQDCRAEDLEEEEWEEEEEGEEGEGEEQQHQLHQQRAMRHAAASGAVDFARAAGPLVAALTCAAQCPNAATQKRAGEVCSRLRQALQACAHLGQR